MRQPDPQVGLCSICTNARRIVSGRGSFFWMCELSRTDPAFRRYPPLPVRACTGHKDARDARFTPAGDPLDD